MNIPPEFILLFVLLCILFIQPNISEYTDTIVGKIILLFFIGASSKLCGITCALMSCFISILMLQRHEGFEQQEEE